jgi:hypothetical protein
MYSEIILYGYIPAAKEGSCGVNEDLDVDYHILAGRFCDSQHQLLTIKTTSTAGISSIRHRSRKSTVLRMRTSLEGADRMHAAKQ